MRSSYRYLDIDCIFMKKKRRRNNNQEVSFKIIFNLILIIFNNFFREAGGSFGKMEAVHEVLHLFFSMYRGFRTIVFNGGLYRTPCFVGQCPVGTDSYLGSIACIQCCKSETVGVGSGYGLRSVSDPDPTESFGSFRFLNRYRTGTVCYLSFVLLIFSLTVSAHKSYRT